MARLDTLKVGNIRSLMNQEIQVITQAETFNQKFNQALHEDSEDPDAALQFASKEAEVDYFAGVTQSLKDDLKQEMMLEQRNILFQIRSAAPTEYKLVDVGFNQVEYEPKK